MTDMILRASSTIKPFQNTSDIIVRFYRGELVHPSGYAIQDVWGFSPAKLEKVHDYIQWIFPLQKPSEHVYDIPVLNPSEIEAFHTDAELRQRVQRSFRMMIEFYGFIMKDDVIVKGAQFREKSRWVYPKDHNMARLSRILESLRLLNFEPQARALFQALNGIYQEYRWEIGESMSYWQRTMRGT
jgi:hypothetical protein